MSGEAGWSLTSELYSIFVGSGVNVSIATPPGAAGNYVGEYFARESRPYREWLERARPALDALFVELRQRLPIVPMSEKFEQVDGRVIEELDRKAAHFEKFTTGLPGPVYLQGAQLMPDYRTMNLKFLVRTRIRRAELDPIVPRVVAILLAHQSD